MSLRTVESAPAVGNVPGVDTVFDQMTCSTCLCTFNLSNRSPRILECGHSFCSDCLQSAVNQKSSITCSLCDKVHSQVDVLPVNVFLTSLMSQLPSHMLNTEGLQSATRIANCSQCVRAKPGTHKCEDCNLLYCNIHAAAHEVDCETHRVIAAGIDVGPGAVDKKGRCTVHDKDFEAYCNTCLVPVCVSCTIFSHRGTNHDLIDLRKARQTAFDSIASLLPDAEQRVKRLSSVLVQYQQTREQLLSAMTETSSNVTAYFNSLIAQLEKRRDALKSENESTVMQHVRTMESKEQLLAHHTNVLRAVTGYARQEVEKEGGVTKVPSSPANGIARSKPASHAQRILMLNRMRADVSSHVAQFATEPSLFEWPEFVVSRFAVSAPASSALPVQALGELLISTVSVPDTLVRGDLLNESKSVRAGERCELSVQLRDASVRAVQQSGWQWSARLVSLQSATIESPQVQIRDMGAGSYSIAFIATEGLWKLVLSTRGQELPVVEFAVSGGVTPQSDDPMQQLTARTRSQTLNLIELFSASKDSGLPMSSLNTPTALSSPVKVRSTVVSPQASQPVSVVTTPKPKSELASPTKQVATPKGSVNSAAAVVNDSDSIESMRARARAEAEAAENDRRRAEVEAAAESERVRVQKVAQQAKEQEIQHQEAANKAALEQKQAAEAAEIAALTNALKLEQAAAVAMQTAAQSDEHVAQCDERAARARVRVAEARAACDDAASILKIASDRAAAQQLVVQSAVAAANQSPDDMALAAAADEALKAFDAAMSAEKAARLGVESSQSNAQPAERELIESERELLAALDEHEQLSKHAAEAAALAERTSSVAVRVPPGSARGQQLAEALVAAAASREQTPHTTARQLKTSSRAPSTRVVEPANAMQSPKKETVSTPKVATPTAASAATSPKAAVVEQDAKTLMEQARSLQRTQPVVAFEYFQRAASQGDIEALGELSHCYQFSQGTSKNPAMAFELARRGHEAGSTLATSALARCYRTGTGVEKDPAQAFALFTAAAKNGEAWGLCGLGVCFDDGIGCEKSASRAAECYEAAASLGHAQSISIIGLCYANGSGVAKDTSRAVEFYRRGAALGHANSICNLGVCFENGTGVEKDVVQAVSCYQRGAELGHAHSMYYLGLCHEFGKGDLQKSKDAAKQWFKRAADLGDADAKKRLK